MTSWDPPSSPDSSADDDGEFESEVLREHNRYRKEYLMPKLKLRRELCTKAKRWAKELAKTNRFERSYQHDYGESLYVRTTKRRNYRRRLGEHVVDYWWNTYQNFLEHKPWNEEAAPFTQILWGSTEYIGCGKRRNRQFRKMVVVCYYMPRGNVRGYYYVNLPEDFIDLRNLDTFEHRLESRGIAATAAGLPDDDDVADEEEERSDSRTELLKSKKTKWREKAKALSKPTQTPNIANTKRDSMERTQNLVEESLDSGLRLAEVTSDLPVRMESGSEISVDRVDRMIETMERSKTDD